MNIKAITLVILTAALAGCAIPQVSLKTQAQANMGQVDGILIIPQNNLDVTVPATNPGNSGLIGALVVAVIDTARQSSAEKAAAPMLEVLRDYDFRPVMHAASTDTLTRLDKVKFVDPLRVELVASDSARRIAFQQSAASAILFCNIGYRLQNGNLYVTVRAEMYPKADALKQFRNQPAEGDPLDRGNVIYRKTFVFTKQAVTPASIKADLAEGAASVARQLAADLNAGV